MLGKLFVHVADDERFLLVRRDLRFPYARFDRGKWRVLAFVEPMSDAAAKSLQRRGFCEYHAHASENANQI